MNSTLVLILLTALAALAAWLVVTAMQSRSHANRAEGLRQELEAQGHRSQARLDELLRQVNALEGAVARLSKWESVADADEKATALIHEAEVAAAALRAEATRIGEQAQADAKAALASAEDAARELRQAASEKAKSSGAQADAILADAHSRADAVIAAANKNAEQVAGDALRALRDAEQLERAVRAMKNTIEGYGDQYLIPSHTLLDDLAEEFGHEEAGQKLKVVRDQIRRSVRAGRAGQCDYVEDNRKETAVRFVVDAFNGKVDSTLARVRDDNAGTLGEEIRDAYALVNMNGKAFRNARITEEYLALRLEELRWAATVQELKVQERDEQRRIREQIREEDKARREYERAMKEAARDEETARRAMEKAQQMLAKATDEQKARYEEQLRELEAKLKQAEERNQRAQSMAQQTKRGHVYVISNLGSFGEHVYKIGLTRRLEPLDRIRELGDSSVPFEFDVHAMIFAEDAPALEHQLHKHFLLSQVNKVNARKEFFRVDLAHIRGEIEKFGLAAHWSMAARAQEYRESMRIEELIRESPEAREAWLKRQLELEPAIGFAEDGLGPEDADRGRDESVAVTDSRANLLAP